MMSHRALEVFLGVVTLVSVVSVPVPRRVTAPAVKPPAHIDLRRVEELHRVSQAQRSDVARLARDTQALADMLRVRDGGTVTANPPPPENEEHECSQ
jgi:hypothetical protein